MQTAIETRTKGFIGRCTVKGCNCVVRVDIPLKSRIHTSYPFYVPGANQRPQPVKSTIWEPIYGAGQLFLHCWQHRRPLRFKEVNGTFSDAHICDARCMDAKGPDCECSCGGANHGGSYRLNV